MIKNELQKALKVVPTQRDDVIAKLVGYLETDMLLFLGAEKELLERQEKKWLPLVHWFEELLNVCIKISSSIEVPVQEERFSLAFKGLLSDLTDKELVAFYKAALVMRSVMLAYALIKGKISVEEAFDAAFLEEIWQAEHWGNDAEAEQKRADMKTDLQFVIDFLHEDKAA